MGTGPALPAVVAVGVLAGLAAPATSHLAGLYPSLRWDAYAGPESPLGCHLRRGSPVCDVSDPQYGAAGDGHTDDTAAIQRAIWACGARALSPDGGDRAAVVLPSGGRFVSGALNLTSGVNLVVQRGATLLGSTSPGAYPVVPHLPGYPTCRDGGYPVSHAYGRHQALLSGWNLANVSVCGGGVIDGRGLTPDPELLTSWVDRFKTKSLDWGRPRVWEPMFATDVAFFNVTVINQAFWALHPYASTRVYIGDVNVTAPRDEGIPNDDGIDPDSCSDVLVERCFVSVGDNSVAIKSGLDLAGRVFARPSFNMVFRDSTFACETFAVGSEMSGDVFNITVDNCTFGGSGSDFAGVHLKSERGRGGSVHGLRFHNLIFHSEASWKQPCPFSASLFYSGNPPPTNASATPRFYDVEFVNVMVYPPVAATKPRDVKPAFAWIGLPESKLDNFRFRNITVVSPPDGFRLSVGWACTDVSNFSFEAVSPAPEASSKCIGGAPEMVPAAAAAPSVGPSAGVVYPPSAAASSATSGGVVDVTAPPYSADPTGATDATAALIKAYNSIWLRTNCSGTGTPPSVDCLTSVNHRILYFPPGLYRLSRSLEFTVDRRWGPMELDNMIHFQGHATDTTVLRLDDSAPGFGSAAAPRAVLSFIRGDNQSNVAMMNTIADLTIDVGHGNPGADALKFTANNCGSVRRVALRGTGGNVALRLTAGETGLALTKNVSIAGFRFGIAVNSSHPGHVVEHVAMSDIAVAGVVVYDNQIAVRGLRFTTTVATAKAVWIVRSGRGVVVLIDSTVQLPLPAAPGSPRTRCALDNAKGFLFARNVTVSGGFDFAVCNGSAGVFPWVGSGTVDVAEWSSWPWRGVLGAPPQTLRLPVFETPVPELGSLDSWADVSEFGAHAGDGVDDTAAVQRALDSGRPIVFFPPGAHGAYDLRGTLDIPPSVVAIELLWAYLNVSTPGLAPLRSLFRTTGRAPPRHVVTIQHGHGSAGFVYWIELASADNRTVVLSELMGSQKLAFDSAPGGRLFVEASCCGSVMLPCINLSGTQMWGRAFDPEANPSPTPKVLLSTEEAALWTLGFKTEGPSTDFEVRGGAALELLGGELNRFRGAHPGDLWRGQPSFAVTDSRVSVVAAECGPDPPEVEVCATHDGRGVNLSASAFSRRDAGSGGPGDVVMAWSV